MGEIGYDSVRLNCVEFDCAGQGWEGYITVGLGVSAPGWLG